MTTTLRQAALRAALPPEQIGRLTEQIYHRVLRESVHLDRGNFTVIHPHDLRRMFDLYDQAFFAGCCHQTLDERGNRIDFRLSRRMTKAGGKTTRFQWRPQPQGPLVTSYEITVSTTLLFQTFGDVQRSVRVSGVLCQDRLQAMQRIMEHEIVHLVEMLEWFDSNCAATRFQSITHNLFGHTDHTHDLITASERARTRYGIRPGDRVRFELDGVPHVGVVNRITRRATVLVEDLRGARYSDGKRYAKFYVPLSMLEPCLK
ncbi:MAG: hypothetical protein J5I93_25350 [Pirellulaceae bacterium]|nr:hypothetical protein [Pirellulaceae bacterium]